VSAFQLTADDFGQEHCGRVDAYGRILPVEKAAEDRVIGGSLNRNGSLHALYPVWGLRLSPVLANAAMALSSFSVVTNSPGSRRLKLA